MVAAIATFPDLHSSERWNLVMLLSFNAMAASVSFGHAYSRR